MKIIENILNKGFRRDKHNHYKKYNPDNMPENLRKEFEDEEKYQELGDDKIRETANEVADGYKENI